MRALIIGTGGISNSWFPALKHHGVTVAGAVDLDAKRARAQLEKHEVDTAEVFTDLEKALAQVQADFAVDLTTPGAHRQVTCSALEAGLPVIGEKPMAENLEEARAMVATAEKTGKLYMVSQSRRYQKTHRQVADTIAAGRIGEVTTVICNFFLGIHFGGFRDVMDHVLLNDMAIHHFDLARMFTGLDAQSVFAEEFNPAGSWYRSGPAAHCLFRMSGDVRFAYCGSWCAEGGPASTSWNGSWRIVGTRGTIILADDAAHGHRVTGTEGSRRETEPLELVPAEEGRPQGQGGALAQFLAALAGGPTPQGECHDNIKSMAMVCSAIESSARDARVSCEVGEATGATCTAP